MSKNCICIDNKKCCMCCKNDIKLAALPVKDPFTDKHFTNRNESIKVDTMHYICKECKDI